MNTFLNQILPVLQTAVLGVLVATITYVGQAVVKAIPSIIDLVIAKVGLTKYNRYKLIAQDVWLKIEEDGRLGDFVGDKTIEFYNLMKIKFPSITDADINLLNKALAGEINKDKEVIAKDLDVTPVAEKIDNTIAETPIKQEDIAVEDVLIETDTTTLPIKEDVVEPIKEDVVVPVEEKVSEVVLGVLPVDETVTPTTAETIAKIQSLLSTITPTI